jgi:hypothetical protein
MNFSRLLATGRSLVGVRDTDTPYRMRKGTFLPKFESVKNPFIAPPKPEPEEMAGAAARVAEPPAAPATTPFPNGALQISWSFPELTLQSKDGLGSDAVPAVADICAGNPLIPSFPPSGGEGRGEGALKFSEDAAEGPSRPVKKENPGPCARLLEVFSAKETARIIPITPTRKESVLARAGSTEAAKEPVRDGAAPPSVKPGKAPSVVGLMDASPLGLKTGIASKDNQPAAGPVAQPAGNSNFLAAFVKKLNPLAWLPARKPEGPRMRPWQTRAVVQAELSLENVKVLRNELNDSDLQVIPTRTAAKPVAAGSRLRPVGEIESTAFGRMTSRFFGQGQPQVR